MEQASQNCPVLYTDDGIASRRTALDMDRLGVEFELRDGVGAGFPRLPILLLPDGRRITGEDDIVLYAEKLNEHRRKGTSS